MSVSRSGDSLLDFIRKYLEYVLVILIILECNSFFLQSTGNNDGSGFWVYVNQACILIALAILFLLILKTRNLRPLLSLLPIGAAYYTLAFLFFLYNVRVLAPQNAADYTSRFLFFLPLMICVFCYEREIGEPFILWFRYADIVLVFSCLNLLVFIILSFSPEILQSDLIQTRWAGYIKSLRNFYNICAVQLGVYREALGLRIFRNFGIFTEPLMFCIPLITALSTEMFLRRRAWSWIWKCLILSLVIFTAQSDFGFILAFFLWGIKAVQVLPRKYRKTISPIVAVGVVLFCSFIFQKKGILYGQNELSSLGMHLADYKYSFLAFREHPLLGGGYWNDAYISSFMPPDRFAKNPGLSNTIGVVFGEGGIVLGAICTIPFLLGLMQLFHKGNRPLSLWFIGIFGIFAGIIFRFRLYLIIILAFGYSLLGIGISGQHLTFFPKLQWPSEKNISDSHIKNKWIPYIFAGGVFVLFLLRKPFFSVLYLFLNSYRFLLGQSVWKTLLVFLELVLFICYLLRIWKTAAITNLRKKIVTAYLVFGSVMYFAVYPCISEWINAVFNALQIQPEPWESICLFGIYLIFLYIPGEIIYEWEDSPSRRIGCAFTAFIILCGSGLAFHKASSILDYQTRLLPESDIKAVSIISEVSGSKLYANHKSALYHRLYPSVKYTTAKNLGFTSYENASAIFENGADLPELFNAGYQVTRLSDESLLYSNDDAVITALSDHGYDFYRYYPYPVNYDMGYAATLNGLERTTSGGVFLNGTEHSLTKGPYDSLDAGEYTVTYMLRLESGVQPSGIVYFVLQVSCNEGDIIIAEKNVTSELINYREIQIELPFTTVGAQNVEYKVLASDGIRLEIDSISIQKTPNSVVLYDYDSLEQPVSVRYFSQNNIPCVTDEGYHVLKYSYDKLGRIIDQKYEDIFGQPVIIQGGFAGVQYERNYMGNPTRISYYGIDGNLILIPAHYAIIKNSYGRLGTELLSVEYLDTEGNPILSANGYATCQYTSNDDLQIIREDYLDTSGQPIMLPSGYASIEYEYDINGNRTVFRLLDCNGMPVLGKGGYSELRRTFNDKKQIVRESYFNIDATPLLLPKGYSSVEFEYDNVGNCISYRYLDILGTPVVINNGYAELIREYNSKQQVIREAYLDVDGSLIILPGGFSEVEYEYDEDGNQIHILYVDSRGNPCMIWNQYSEVWRTFDEHGQIISVKYLDLDGNEILS